MSDMTENVENFSSQTDRELILPKNATNSIVRICEQWPVYEANLNNKETQN